MVVDPVCGIDVDDRVAEVTEQLTSHYDGSAFYFCSQDCQDAFDQSPEHYARRLNKPTAA
jgi:YHS domain-containing protein